MHIYIYIGAHCLGCGVVENFRIDTPFWAFGASEGLWSTCELGTAGRVFSGFLGSWKASGLERPTKDS